MNETTILKILCRIAVFAALVYGLLFVIVALLGGYQMIFTFLLDYDGLQDGSDILPFPSVLAALLKVAAVVLLSLAVARGQEHASMKREIVCLAVTVGLMVTPLDTAVTYAAIQYYKTQDSLSVWHFRIMSEIFHGLSCLLQLSYASLLTASTISLMHKRYHTKTAG